MYGHARALDLTAELEESNIFLKSAIVKYQRVVESENVTDALLLLAAERCIDRMRFLGSSLKAIPIHAVLIERFKDNPYYRNQAAVSYLMVNRHQEAKRVLHETLLTWPDDGFAQVHYGFILKCHENNMEQGVRFLRDGIRSGANGTMDGRFLYHLGDGLRRLGKNQEAYEIYELGVLNGIFLSKYQRSLYNAENLKAQPWWTKSETTYQLFFNLLEENWLQIREEGLKILNKEGYFQNEEENLRDVGDWKQYELFAKGVKNQANCERTPLTCKLIAKFQTASRCRRGQSKFSVMHPGTHVWPHCGPTNCRLRAHLGLKVPEHTYIRVADEVRSWKEGEVIIFDDSFEHEVWHNGTSARLVLIVDVWHPELTLKDKKSLSAI